MNALILSFNAMPVAARLTKMVTVLIEARFGSQDHQPIVPSSVIYGEVSKELQQRIY